MGTGLAGSPECLDMRQVQRRPHAASRRVKKCQSWHEVASRWGAWCWPAGITSCRWGGPRHVHGCRRCNEISQRHIHVSCTLACASNWL